MLFECLLKMSVVFKKIILCNFYHIHSTGIDLALLSLGNHSILTYGTFGMWGALLADGETVLPSSHRCQFHQYFTSSFFVFCKAFLYYQFDFVISWQNNIGKMLVKLTTEEQRNRKKSKLQIYLAGKLFESVNGDRTGLIWFAQMTRFKRFGIVHFTYF